MSKNVQSKTINYFRVCFRESASYIMEDLLKGSHNLLPNVEDRVFVSNSQEFKGCHVKQVAGKGHYVHVTLVTPGQPANIVPDKENIPEIDVELTSPPPKSNFMDGDMFFLVHGNHVLFCASNLTVSKAKEYICHVFERTSRPEKASNFILQSVADIDKLRLIRQGVRQIRLGCGIYSATEQHEERTFVRRTLFTSLLSEIRALFAEDPILKDFDDNENLKAEVIISLNRARKGSTKGKVRIEALSEKIVKNGEDGFRIETYNGSVLTPSDVILRKEARLEKFGKSVQYEEAWHFLGNYLTELQETGLLEQ